MKSREELVRESLEIEARLLERLGRFDEAAAARNRVPIASKVSATETVERHSLSDPPADVERTSEPPARLVTFDIGSPPEESTPEGLVSAWSMQVAGLLNQADEVQEEIRAMDHHRATLEEQITELRQFERNYRSAMNAHLHRLEETAPDDRTRERVAAFIAILEDPNWPSYVRL